MRIGKWRKVGEGKAGILWVIPNPEDKSSSVASIDLEYNPITKKWSVHFLGRQKKVRGRWRNPKVITKFFNRKKEAISYVGVLMRKYPEG